MESKSPVYALYWFGVCIETLSLRRSPNTKFGRLRRSHRHDTDVSYWRSAPWMHVSSIIVE